MNILDNIPDGWQHEDGRKGPVTVRRPSGEHSTTLPVGVTIGEFLSYRANQNGTWLFDVGQGFPPGWRGFRWRVDHWVDLGFGIPGEFVEAPIGELEEPSRHDPHHLRASIAVENDVVMQKLDVMGHVTGRFVNLAAAQMDKAIRDHLIKLGWTPPPEKPE